jgi:hypothetical protein
MDGAFTFMIGLQGFQWIFDFHEEKKGKEKKRKRKKKGRKKKREGKKGKKNKLIMI